MGLASESLVAKALCCPLCHSMPGTQAADTHLCNNIIKLLIFFRTAIPTSLRCTITLPFNPQIHIYGPGKKIMICTHTHIYVLKSFLPSSTNKTRNMKSKHLKTEYIPMKNTLIVYYCIIVFIYKVCTSAKVWDLKTSMHAENHLAKKLPRTESCTPAIIWSWIKPLSGVPSFGTKYWFLTFTAKKDVQLRILSFIIWLVYVIIYGKLTCCCEIRTDT